MSTEQKQELPEDKIDQVLLEQFRCQGFGDAFGVLWQHHGEKLGRFVRGKGMQEDQARDLLQDIGLKLFRYLSGHVVEMFPGSAYKITKDEIADVYRSLQKLPILETLDDLMALNLEPAAAPLSQRRERWTAAQQHMETCGVSPEQQTAVILHHLIGYTVLEVAQITESDREAVKSRLRYASLKMGQTRKQQGVT